MATHSSVLAWRTPGMGEPGGLPSMGSHKIGHDWSDLAVAAAADGFWGHYDKWNKSQSRQIPCDLTYMFNLNHQTTKK